MLLFLYGDNVLQGSVQSVAFFMLDKVPAPELIAATVESSILPYAEEHEIPFDELLLQYIQVKPTTIKPTGTSEFSKYVQYFSSPSNLL